MIVTKRSITLVVDGKTITYGDADPTFTYSITSYQEGKAAFAPNEDVNTLGLLSLVAVGYVGNAGTFDIEAQGISSTQNYDLTIVNAKYIVNRKDLTLVLGSYTISFGDPIPNFTPEINGFAKGETLASLNAKIVYKHGFVADKTGMIGTYTVEPQLSNNALGG